MMYECHLMLANLYFKEIKSIIITKSQDKGKARVELATSDEDDNIIDESKLCEFATAIPKMDHPERWPINLKVQTINQ